MPFDGIFTSSVVKELSSLVDGKIDKIHQPSKDDIIIFIKKEHKNTKILFSANPSYPRVHITRISTQNPPVPPTFCMILRKHLTGGRITYIKQVDFDRIVEFIIEGKDELGYPVVYRLIIEIMGKHSNIILLNNENIIIDSIKHVGSSISRYREVLPGVKYIQPPTQDKINPLTITKNDLEEIFNRSGEIPSFKVFINSFFGIGKVFSYQICGELSVKKICELSEQEREMLISNFFYYTSKIKSGDFDNFIFYRNSDMVDYYAMSLKEYKDLEKIHFESPGELLDTFYGSRDLRDRLKQKYNDVFKIVTGLIEKNIKKIQIHRSKLEECKDFEKWKLYGDLIMANQYTIVQGSDGVILQNFYDESLSEVFVPLDKEISPVENAKKYYKRYSKEKSTVQIVSKQLEESLEEKDYLETILFNLENASDIETIEEIINELSEMGYIKKRRNGKNQCKAAPHHFISSDGFDIYVGKNNKQNDYLTTKFAISSDIWMHTKNIPGSHVIIKSRAGKVSDTALLEGAILAAYFSKAKNSTNVPVDFTERKNVKKPSGAKPGMVIYYTNRTIYVTPDEEKVNRIKKV